MKMLRKKESSKQNTDSENYELWGYAEAAEFLHLSVVTLRRLVSEGKIRTINLLDECFSFHKI